MHLNTVLMIMRKGNTILSILLLFLEILSAFCPANLASSFEKSIFSQTPLTPWTMTVRLDNTRYSKDWCHNNCRPGELKGQKDVPWPEIITDDIGPHVTTYLSPMQHWDKGGGEFHFDRRVPWVNNGCGNSINLCNDPHMRSYFYFNSFHPFRARWWQITKANYF